MAERPYRLTRSTRARSRLYSILSPMLFAGERRNTAWDRIERLIFVCHGNMFRSPYAEHRARAYELKTISVGIRCKEGEPAAPEAVTVADTRGIDLGAHRSRRLQDFTARSSDMFVLFDPRHRRIMMEEMAANVAGARIVLLGLWCLPSTPLIFDPYGLGREAVEDCYDLIDAGLERLVDERSGASGRLSAKSRRRSRKAISKR